MSRQAPQSRQPAFEPFAIEQGVPVPPDQRSRGLSAALRVLSQAAIGSSMFVPLGATGNAKTPRDHRVRIASRAIGVAGRGWYVVRDVEGGARVWKIAGPKAKA